MTIYLYLVMNESEIISSTSIYDLVLLDVCHFHHHQVIVTKIWPLSGYSCLYLGSLHPRILKFEESAIRFLNVPKIGMLLCRWSSSFRRTCNYLHVQFVHVFTDMTINLRNSYQICNFTEKIHYPSYHMILTFVNEKLSCSSSREI